MGAIVQTPEGIASTHRQWYRYPPTATDLYHGRVESYGSIYRTQPNVRLCVRFLARNIASLALLAYRRHGPANREELPPTHDLAQWLVSPFPASTKPPSRHRFVRTLVEDLAVFDNYYALKLRNSATGRMNVVRVPPTMMRPEGGSFTGPEKYRLLGNRAQPLFDPEQVIHLFGHDPTNPNAGVSSIEALRHVIAEDSAAGEYREQMWRNSARIPGVLSRPVEAPKWSEPSRVRFLEEWRAQWTGSATTAGGTPVLEEGMEFKESGFSAKDAEYLGARKLSREECAAQFFIPPAFVGILENANFSNMKEQHVGLYVDTLGPWLDWITTDFEMELVPDFDDVDDVYLDFDLEQKLRGSFEEQAATLSTSTGAPWLRRNEARARMNLPPVEGGDDLVTPLNVLIGGLASPRDTAPPLPVELGDGAGPPSTASRPAARKTRCAHGAKSMRPELVGWRAKLAEVTGAHFTRQKAAVMSRLGSGIPLEVAYDSDRWDSELGHDLTAVFSGMAEELGGAVASDFGADFDLDRALGYLSAKAEGSARAINTTTLAQVAAALGTPRTGSASRGKATPRASTDPLLVGQGIDALDDLGGVDDETDMPDGGDALDTTTAVADVFDLAGTVRAAEIATTLATAVGQWSRHEGASQAGAGSKTWQVNSDNSRHTDVDGETVPLDGTFSNGARWPGDQENLDVGEVAGCLCSLDFGQ